MMYTYSSTTKVIWYTYMYVYTYIRTCFSNVPIKQFIMIHIKRRKYNTFGGVPLPVAVKLHNKVHSRSVDPRKLRGVRIAINYTHHLVWYTTLMTVQLTLSLRSTVLICISKERRCKEELRGVGHF